MTVLKSIKKTILILIILIMIPTSFGFEACKVEFDQPWFKVNNSNGEDVLIIDSDGDIFALGQDHTINNKDSQESFEIGNNAFFNSITSKYNNIAEKLADLTGINGFIIQDNTGINKAVIENNGNINTMGVIAFQGEQANCLPDGYLYCDSDTRENRDYYCDITGDKTGNCAYNVIENENCATKLSTDTDSGTNYTIKGTVTDFITCNTGTCTFNTYTDYCSGNNVVEYSADGSTYKTNTKNCDDYDYYTCTADKTGKIKHDFSCGNGECSKSEIEFSCGALPSDSVTKSCSGNSVKKITTSYSRNCDATDCSYTTNVDTTYENCGSGACYNGACYGAPDGNLIASPSSWTKDTEGSVPNINIIATATGGTGNYECRWCNDGIVPCNSWKSIQGGNKLSEYTQCTLTIKDTKTGLTTYKFGDTNCWCNGDGTNADCKYNGISGIGDVGTTDQRTLSCQDSNTGNVCSTNTISVIINSPDTCAAAQAGYCTESYQSLISCDDSTPGEHYVTCKQTKTTQPDGSCSY